MSDRWKPHGEVEVLHSKFGYRVELQYLRGPRQTGAHEVTFPDGSRLRALPDSGTTARGRAAAIRAVLARNDDALVEEIIGALVYSGATNLEYGGEPLIRVGSGKWLVLLDDNGTVEARYVKGPDR
jgi:hypothetical protein